MVEKTLMAFVGAALTGAAAGAAVSAALTRKARNEAYRACPCVEFHNMELDVEPL